jgi:hypothetical protein
VTVVKLPEGLGRTAAGIEVFEDTGMSSEQQLDKEL